MFTCKDKSQSRILRNNLLIARGDCVNLTDILQPKKTTLIGKSKYCHLGKYLTFQSNTVRTVFNAPPYFKHRPICNTSNFG